MIMEYKNANTKKAVELSYKTKPFNLMDDNKFQSVIRKFYDSCHYLHLLGKSKPVQYIYVVEASNGDSTMRKRLRDRMKTQLPFALQQNMNTGIKLIDKVEISENPQMSIKELSKMTGLSTGGVKYHLTKLKNEGLVERIGADKGGYWRVR